jgi:hypothetical protein
VTPLILQILVLVLLARDLAASPRAITPSMDSPRPSAKRILLRHSLSFEEARVDVDNIRRVRKVIFIMDIVSDCVRVIRKFIKSILAVEGLPYR